MDEKDGDASAARHRNPNRRPSGVRGTWGSKAPAEADEKALPWESRLGFPPGVTVEDLAQYRRRPALSRPPDNLYPQGGRFIIRETEYKRSFQQPPPFPALEVNVRHEIAHEAKPGEKPSEEAADEDEGRAQERGDKEEEVDFEDKYLGPIPTLSSPDPEPSPGHRPRSEMARRRDVVAPPKQAPDQFIVFLQAKKAELLRRPTSLTLEGEFLVRESELRSKFRRHEGARRSEPARRSTSLKLEGEIERTSESKLKYVEHPRQPRRHSKRISTGLKLEGDIEKKSESTSKYVPFTVTERMESLRRPTNLRLEGDMSCQPEYKDTYRNFNVQRPVVRKCEDHLKMEGEMAATSETMAQYLGGVVMAIRRPDGIIEPIVNYNKHVHGERRHYLQYESMMNKEDLTSGNPGEPGDQPIETEDDDTVAEDVDKLKLENSKKNSDICREHFVDISPTIVNNNNEETSVKRKKSLLHLPDASFQKPEPVRRVQPAKKPVPHQPMASLRLEGRMETSPEYRSSYLDFPRERPVTRKPAGELRRPEARRTPNLSEKHAQYVKHSAAPRTETLRRRSNLQPEGDMDIYPVYRKDYVDYAFNENFVTGRLSPKPPEESRPLQVINLTGCRTRPVSPVAPGPEATGPEGKADSTTTTISSSSEGTTLDQGNYQAFEVLCQSPSYKLMVDQVDDNGNVRPKSPFRARSPSPQRTPSTVSVHSSQAPVQPVVAARRTSPMGKRVQSFVVLDNNNNNAKGRSRRQRNKFLDLPPPPPTAGKASSETNWMPPWYQMPTTL